MAHFEDLSPYSYSSEEILSLNGEFVSFRPRYNRLTVGWLEKGHDFQTGPTPAGFADALLAIVAGPQINAMRGTHACHFCPRSGDHVRAQYGGQDVWMGNAEIRVPLRPGIMFAAPTLIWHYLTAHAYQPPESFITAVETYDSSWMTDQTGMWIPSYAQRRGW